MRITDSIVLRKAIQQAIANGDSLEEIARTLDVELKHLKWWVSTSLNNDKLAPGGNPTHQTYSRFAYVMILSGIEDLRTRLEAKVKWSKISAKYSPEDRYTYVMFYTEGIYHMLQSLNMDPNSLLVKETCRQAIDLILQIDDLDLPR